MIPPGGNPVIYEPSLSRVRAASSADLFVSVGHPAFAWEETWLADLLRRGDVPVVSSAESCDVLPDDPHVWLSLPCARSIAEKIARAVQRARPEAAESIAASLRELLAEMDDLSLHADRSLEPHRGGSFIVLHAAWGYLARDYDLQQIAILDHGSGDAGPGELAAIVEQGRERGLVDVIVQPQFSAQPARLVADELGGNTVMLDPLARDWATTFRETIHVLSVQVRP
jgi:zinc transport system substrate-binding protein